LSEGKYGKKARIAFRISDKAKERLGEVAKMFQLKPAQVAKAILYMHLGVFEPIDNRRRDWRKQRHRTALTWEKVKNEDAQILSED